MRVAGQQPGAHAPSRRVDDGIRGGQFVLPVQVGYDATLDLRALENGRYMVRTGATVVPLQVQH